MAKKPGLSSKLKGVKIYNPKVVEPLWKGPEDPSGSQGGVTQSLLGRFLVCRERFRLLVVHGLSGADHFESRIEYGNLWHVCEEAISRNEDWEKPLLAYAQQLAKQYTTEQGQVDKWYNVCKIQFPVYVDYWKKHPDVVTRLPVVAEVPFNVPYPLPSGRVVWLRGKWDSVDLIPKAHKRPEKLVLQENKTKSKIDVHSISRSLAFDIQTMMYLVALDKLCEYTEHGVPPLTKISNFTEDIIPADNHWGNCSYGALSNRPRTVRYNVIRRPLSGGTGTIRPHKATSKKPAETMKEYYERLQGLIVEAPDTYFARWEVSVSGEDIANFEKRFLIPCLEFLCMWWDAMKQCSYDPWNFAAPNCFHWQHPFNVYNSINETGYSDFDEHLATGSMVGLRQLANLFPEL